MLINSYYSENKFIYCKKIFAFRGKVIKIYFMDKVERAILASKTPEEYVDKSVKSNLSPARKAVLSREWLKKSGYTRMDILHARNRHPYWKKKKSENSAERAKRRLSMHDYSTEKVLVWSKDLIGRFLDMSKTDRNGKYEKKDHELAAKFKTTIPSIQYMRRKLKLVKKLVGSKATKDKLVEYMGRSESLLKKGKAAVDSYAKQQKNVVKPTKKTSSAKTRVPAKAKTTTKSAKKKLPSKTGKPATGSKNKKKK